MSSNIVGQPLEPYVGEQIKKRQEIYGSGTPGNSRSIEEISYLNSRTAWVKLASGTSMNKKRLDLLKKNGNELVGSEEGLALAKNNVLFGGLSRQQGNKLVERSGITGADKAYGVGGTDFGFSPMPGIVDASINCLNNGSLKKATINIKAHNKNQFDIIDALYMRLGYTVLLEWGNDKYFTNPPNSSLTPIGPTLVESQFFDSKNNETSYVYWLPEIERLRKEKSGNYDALFGIVSNFNWTFETDGTYSIQVMLYTMGDVMESFKMKVPVPSKITTKDLKTPPQGQTSQPDTTSNSEEFKTKFVNEDGSVKEDEAIEAGYYWFDNSLDTVRFSRVEEKYQEANPGKNFSDLRVYEDTSGGTFSFNDSWFYVLSDKTIYESAMGKISDPNIPSKSTSPINTKVYKKGDTYEEALKRYTEVKKKEVVEENSEVVTAQVEKLQESKIHYLLYQIQKIADETIISSYKDKLRFTKFNIEGGVTIDMGKILNKKEELRLKLKGLGLITSDTTDVVSTDISITNKEGKNAYYIRLGTFLDYIQNQVFMKIVQKDDFISYLQIDTSTKNNIMYTIPNQLSTDPNICIIKNESFDLTGGVKMKYWDGLENYIGEVGEGITYGKIMNIYLNFDYILKLLDSSDKVSVFSFLNGICNDLNFSLGKVNNLQPVINSESNKITIIDQTPIQGKDEIAKALNLYPTPKSTTLEVFGYNPNDNTSNFVKGVGLTTEITKEYATMITIGATAGGYIPGEEATAFSRWNVGIEDRFKKNLGDGSSNEVDPITNFEKENEGIKRKYVEYLSQDVLEIVGLNIEGPPYNIDYDKISSNTSIVGNFNKYLQASASLSTDTAESSVGFIPFNLHLTMDGLSGIKVFNKLEITQGFLPSNYPETLEFIITQVNHKLLSNTWETELSTQGTSKTNPKGSIISNKTFSSTAERITKEVADLSSVNGVNANILRQHLKMLGYTEKGKEIDNGGDISREIREAGEAVFKEIKKQLPSLKVRVTSGNDAYHQNLNYNSRHKKGNGLDFTISPSSEFNLNAVVEILEKFAFANNPKFRFIDEYRRLTSAGTANHFHISWGAGTEAQATLNQIKKKYKGQKLSSFKIKV
tara:strand:+ start:135 stop:3437 length:3303 start_codon:yes stop_codon:yes gene_type:complete